MRLTQRRGGRDIHSHRCARFTRIGRLQPCRVVRLRCQRRFPFAGKAGSVCIPRKFDRSHLSLRGTVLILRPLPSTRADAIFSSTPMLAARLRASLPVLLASPEKSVFPALIPTYRVRYFCAPFKPSIHLDIDAPLHPSNERILKKDCESRWQPSGKTQKVGCKLRSKTYSVSNNTSRSEDRKS